MTSLLLSFAGEVFAPLSMALSDRADFEALIEELGWVPVFTDAQVTAFQQTLALADLLEDLAAEVADLSQGPLEGAEVEALILTVQDVFMAVSALSNLQPADLTGLPRPFDDPASWRTMALDLPEYLVLTWLARTLPAAYEVLHFVGAIVEETREHLPPRRTLLWDRLMATLADPGAAVAATYGWGGEFDHARLLTNLGRLLTAAGLRPELADLRAELTEPLLGAAPEAAVQEIGVSPLPLRQVLESLSPAALVLAPSAPRAGAAPNGLGVVMIATGPFDGSGAFGQGYAAALSMNGAPGETPGLAFSPSGNRLLAGGDEALATFELSWKPPEPFLLAGAPDGTRLEVVAASAAVTLDVNSARPVFRADLTVGGDGGEGLRLVILPANGDTFVADVLGGDELAILAGIGASWDSEGGFRFEGSAGFAVVLPLNLKVGPVQIDRFDLSVLAAPAGIEAVVAVTGSVDLGLLAVVAEAIGIELHLAPKPEGEPPGAFGSFDLTAGFKPPTGFGLVVDAAGLVTGGGFLSLDRGIGRYSGVAQVSFLGLGLSAVGIIETRLAGVPDGWSMFLSVFSEFPPLQLGFGFTLNGVGGLIGINRTLDYGALASRMMARALDSAMFPEDPIVDAPAILADVAAIFPPSEGQFVFGAMCKIGWGTPTLIDADLGVVLELPDPVRVTLLGQVAAELPTHDFAIIELHMDVAGSADLTAGTLAVDAVLRDSHIAHLINLAGAMSMRAVFEGKPSFLLAVGGFHPAFTPPPGFPTLARVCARIPVGPAADVGLSGYLAVTSNTFQIGGRVELLAWFVGFSAEGYVKVDALIQVSPFLFDVRSGFGATIRAGSITLMGVDVRARVTGPSPIEVFGTASFEILGFEKGIDLHLTTGGGRQEPRPSEDVGALVTAALADAGSLSASPDPLHAGTIRFRDSAAGIDPASLLTLLQKVAPLNQDLDRFGPAKITGARRITLDAATLGGSPLGTDGYFTAIEWFAPAQFFDIDDAEKLKRPSFEEMDAGLVLSVTTEKLGHQTEVADSYEEVTVDPLADAPDVRSVGAATPVAVQSAFERRFSAARRTPR